MKQIFFVNVADPTVLVLALAWSMLPAWPSSIAVSLSTGQIGIFDYRIPDAPMRFVPAHSLEAWTIAWSTTTDLDGSPYLYSGGDDSALSVHNTRDILHMGAPDTSPSVEMVYECTSRDAKTHGAGVTAILPLTVESARNREILLTGSYDEFLRILVPKLPGRRTAVLAEKRLDGGVWRLKQLEAPQAAPAGEKKFKILASCMHAGVKIVEVSCSDEDWSIRILGSFEEHESMNYASDAQQEENDEEDPRSKTYISSSFYDKRLCAWQLKDEYQSSHDRKNEQDERLYRKLESNHL